MTLSRLANDNGTTLEADEESAETAEYLVIGHPPGYPRRHVQHAAELGVLAAVALTTWLLPSSSNIETDLLPLTSSTAAAEQAVPASGRASAGRYATPVEPLAAYADFCQHNPTRCVSTTPTALSDIGYVQFCENSPTLCIVAKPK